VSCVAKAVKGEQVEIRRVRRPAAHRRLLESNNAVTFPMRRLTMTAAIVLYETTIIKL